MRFFSPSAAGVVSNGEEQITFLTFDCIGLLYPQLEEIRIGVKKQAPNYPVHQIVMSSTHTHSGPDVVGLWGANTFSSGVDTSYIKFLIEQSIEVILQASDNMMPVTAQYIQTTHGDDWVYNISEDNELDRSLTALQFIS